MYCEVVLIVLELHEICRNLPVGPDGSCAGRWMQLRGAHPGQDQSGVRVSTIACQTEPGQADLGSRWAGDSRPGQ